MQQYKICSLNPVGHIEFAHDINCRDDLDALAEGERISSSNDVEIWQGARLVARVKQGNAPLTAADHFSL